MNVTAAAYDPMMGPIAERGMIGKALDWCLDRIIFTPPSPPTPIDKNKVKWISFKEGVNIAISIHAPSKGKAKKMAAIFSYGNSGDLGAVQPLLQKLADKLHITVVGYDYIGYGSSSGSPSARGMELSILAVYGFLLVHYRPNQIYAIGHSMGTAASLALARRAEVAGTVLISSFKSILEAHPFTNWICLAKDDFMLNIEMITETVSNSRVFLIHGKEDKTIPIENSYALEKEIENTPRCYPPFWVDGMDHNSIIEDGGIDVIAPKITAFLTKEFS